MPDNEFDAKLEQEDASTCLISDGGESFGFIVNTLDEIRETGTARCVLCPEGDNEVHVGHVEGFGEVFEELANHGIEVHDLPEDEPWTDEMLKEANVEP